jgi:xylulokinase
MAEYYCGIDLGSTAVKAAVFDEKGRLCGEGVCEFLLETPRPEFVELDPELYWSSTCKAVNGALLNAGISADEVKSAGLTGQAETLILLDRKGAPLRKAIVWLDNRAVDEARELEERFGADELISMSGQTAVLPCWPAPKLLWVKHHEREIFDRIGKVLMVEDFVAWRLTGEFFTHPGLLPSTLYYDMRKNGYAAHIAEYIGLDLNVFPELSKSAPARELFPNALVTVAPMDHICGHLGSGGAEGLVTECTGGSLALCAMTKELVIDPQRRISTYLGWRQGEFTLLPWAPTAGMMMKKFRDEFAGGMSYAELDRAAAAVPAGSDGVILLPHLAGAVSPVAAPHARGAVKGLTLAHTRGHIARAIMESVAFLLKDNANALIELGTELKTVRALGGGAKSSLWAQIKADVLGLPVSVGSCDEPVALGAAILSAAAAGAFSSAAEAGRVLACEEKVYLPGKDAETYEECFKEYCKFNEYILGEK